MAKKPVSPTGSVSELRSAIERRYPAPGYVTMFEVRDATGFDSGRSADAMTVGMYRSRGLQIEGFEIKISRSDWLHEMKQPGKSEVWLRHCHRWWLVTHDANIVLPGELPPSWGMLVLGARGRLDAVHVAPSLHPEPLTMRAMTALMHAGRQQVIAGEAERIRVAKAEGYEQGKHSSGWEAKNTKEELDMLRKQVNELEAACGYRIVHDGLRYGGMKPDQVAKVVALLREENRQSEDFSGMVSQLKWKAEGMESAARLIREAHDGLAQLIPVSGIPAEGTDANN